MSTAAMPISRTNLIVTTSVDGRSHSRVWDSAIPLTIGHPFRWAIERTAQGVRIRDLMGGAGSWQDIASGDLEKGAEIMLADGFSCRLRAARKLLKAVPVTNPSLIPDIPAIDPARIATDPELAWFKKALQISGGVLALVVGISWLWPRAQPKTEELIPPQFAKIVMTQPKKEPSGSQGRAGSSQNAATKAKDAAVVQAFRAKALQNSISGLLKGGLTTLLAQSDYAAGSGKSADARTMFNSKSSGLQATGPMTGNMDGRNVQVAALGAGGGGLGGTGVGYGKGEKAGVAGQGKGFVSMDVPGANVEEGLTKDEVGAVIHAHMSEIRYCYESSMIRSPDLEGKLIIDFTIGAAGAVKSASVKSSTLSDPRLDDCVLRRLLGWKFPNPKGGIDVAVTYPFIFKSLGR